MRHDFIVTNNLATQELVRHNTETIAKMRVSSAEYSKAAKTLDDQADHLSRMNKMLTTFASEDFLFGEDAANTKVVADPIPESVSSDPLERTIDNGGDIPDFLKRPK